MNDNDLIKVLEKTLDGYLLLYPGTNLKDPRFEPPETFYDIEGSLIFNIDKVINFNKLSIKDDKLFVIEEDTNLIYIFSNLEN